MSIATIPDIFHCPSWCTAGADHDLFSLPDGGGWTWGHEGSAGRSDPGQIPSPVIASEVRMLRTPAGGLEVYEVAPWALFPDDLSGVRLNAEQCEDLAAGFATAAARLREIGSDE